VSKLTSTLASIQKQLQGRLPGAAATPAPTTPPQAQAAAVPGGQQPGLCLVAMQGAL
jgi:hypothetical protein